MTYEFEGRTEKEAIDRAAEELGLEKDDFDVEILEVQRQGLFRKGHVRIKVHTGKTAAPGRASPEASHAEGRDRGGAGKAPPRQAAFSNPEAQGDFEQRVLDFVSGLIEHMGYGGTVSVLFREERKIGLKIESDHSSILIGKKGKNLDAMQLLANIYATRQGRDDVRIVLDTENYRIRREESLVRLAYTVADRVREAKGSVLLEPMNPFDRRLIHTTLNDIADVDTKSEGDGLYKQVRVFYKGLH